MSTRLNWRFQLRAEYLQSFLMDLDADLAQFDSADAWTRRQEAAAATVLALYDARVGQVLAPRVRLRVLQGEGSFGQGITSDAAAPAELPDLPDFIAALRAVPELKVAAGEVLYQSIGNRASLALLRKAALELRGVIAQQLGSDHDS
jgi:hypothetical protein